MAEPGRATAACFGLSRLLGGLSAATLAVSLLPLGASRWWAPELFAHFRLQYLAASLALFGIAVVLRRPLCTAALAACLVINAIPAWPYLALASTPQSAETGPSLSILNMNVWANNHDHVAILASIEAADADLVLINELTQDLADRLGSIEAGYPFRILAPRGDKFGLALLSRYPLIDGEIKPLARRLTIETGIETEAGRIAFIGVHLVPPTTPARSALRNTQLTELARRTQTLAAPAVVCGDFNLTPYSPFFRRFLDATGFVDARARQRPDVSWPSDLPLLGIPIDHCLLSSGFAASRSKRLGANGSDHYPVLFELWLNPNDE